jgi:hypothetical protein
VLLWREGDAALHRRQLDVTFTPLRLLERTWQKVERDATSDIPSDKRPGPGWRRLVGQGT